LFVLISMDVNRLLKTDFWRITILFGMAIKAVLVDESETHHLILGVNRENVDSILSGNVFTFPKGMLSGLTDDSDVVVLFAETDEQ
jgi:hypothetical protein